VDKKDNKFKMCIDYHALNKITIKNNYPLPHIDDLLDQLNGAKYFNRTDLKSRYHLIHIIDDDVKKMALSTKYGSYKFLVTPFRLCNASSTFIALMNSTFHEKLNEFMIIYIDDILVYSKIVEEHVKHLKHVLSKLQKKNSLLTRRKMNLLKKRWIS
jgi:hypothetical protein